MRSKTGFAFVRCATLRDRPGQADMLHVDLWWRGQNVALDAGTYSYNAPEPWNNPLARTLYHNTRTVDDCDQMDRSGRFMWLPWLCSRVRCCQRSSGGLLTYWEGEHTGYQRLKSPVIHRRAVLRIVDESWLILDALKSRDEHGYRLHWLLPDWPHEWDGDTARMRLHTSVGDYYARFGTASGKGTCFVIRADEHSPRGWRAPYYAYREPVLSVGLVLQAKSVLFWTLFHSGPCDVIVRGRAISVQCGPWECAIVLQGENDRPVLIDSVSLAGAVSDRLDLVS